MERIQRSIHDVLDLRRAKARLAKVGFGIWPSVLQELLFGFLALFGLPAVGKNSMEIILVPHADAILSFFRWSVTPSSKLLMPRLRGWGGGGADVGSEGGRRGSSTKAKKEVSCSRRRTADRKAEDPSVVLDAGKDSAANEYDNAWVRWTMMTTMMIDVATPGHNPAEPAIRDCLPGVLTLDVSASTFSLAPQEPSFPLPCVLWQRDGKSVRAIVGDSGGIPDRGVNVWFLRFTAVQDWLPKLLDMMSPGLQPKGIRRKGYGVAALAAPSRSRLLRWTLSGLMLSNFGPSDARLLDEKYALQVRSAALDLAYTSEVRGTLLQQTRLAICQMIDQLQEKRIQEGFIEEESSEEEEEESEQTESDTDSDMDDEEDMEEGDEEEERERRAFHVLTNFHIFRLCMPTAEGIDLEYLGTSRDQEAVADSDCISALLLGIPPQEYTCIPEYPRKNRRRRALAVALYERQHLGCVEEHDLMRFNNRLRVMSKAVFRKERSTFRGVDLKMKRCNAKHMKGVTESCHLDNTVPAAPGLPGNPAKGTPKSAPNGKPKGSRDPDPSPLEEDQDEVEAFLQASSEKDMWVVLPSELWTDEIKSRFDPTAKVSSSVLRQALVAFQVRLDPVQHSDPVAAISCCVGTFEECFDCAVAVQGRTCGHGKEIENELATVTPAKPGNQVAALWLWTAKEKEAAELPAGQGQADASCDFNIGDKVITSSKKKKSELDLQTGITEKFSTDKQSAHVRLQSAPKTEHVQRFMVKRIRPSKRDHDDESAAPASKKKKGEETAKELLGDLADGL
ncbi:unnamed protein product [Symbiodinium microadriaticum]|nr:unnamed protein product [Symbiodinium microadriaticum]